MPVIRRSSRIQTKTFSKTKESKSPEKITQKNEPEVAVSKDTESDSEEDQNCIACKQKHPPIKRYPKNHWIQCDNCDQWWHIECACITKEDNEKLTRHNINYCCAICVLKGSSWIQENHNLPLKDSIIKKDPLVSKDTRPEIESNLSSNTKLPVNLAEKNKTDKDCFIVIDNISSPKKFRSSVDIRKEIKRFPDFEKPKHAFSLPKGGIALQYGDTNKADEALKSLPKEAFGSDSSPHKATGTKEIKTGFVKKH